jgi:flagellar secretion chaperone FliS
MAIADAAATYQQVSSHGRSPVGMIVALYDTILRDFGRALAALEAGNVEARVAELNHAIAVIGHLEETLDHQRGGEAAQRFRQFYQVTRGMIVAANVKADRKSISELVELYAPMREAWHQAEQKLPSDAAPTAPRLAGLTTPSPRVEVPVEVEVPRGRWSA